ncbi:PP2C family protein-serine/threonine phosphatase [Streptomyces sp. SAJ15]|uniref:PP2C family protein-serine/threonine phosphatase n=1 Tax=Streptomyces sp. SAJ15 TaxID=2011095 RepID=UPI001186F951|nr:SpoIIE family protein phosphatase [Streptomyces sp. SAJ15]TVL92301.1 serine/threonine protein phosphatase [Streptomyces sp. SAJ15]
MSARHLPKVAGIDPPLPSPAHTADPVAPPPAPAPAPPPNGLVLDRLAGWVSDLTTLHELTERLARTATLDTALDELLQAGATLVGARRGLVALEPADGLGPVTTVGLGLGRADLGHIETIPRGTASAAHLLDGLPEPHAQRPEVIHPDLAREADLDPRHREVAARLGYAASYAVPLDPHGEPGPGARSPLLPVTPPAPSAPSALVSAASAPSPLSAPPVTPRAGGAADLHPDEGSATPGRLGAAVWLYDEPTEPVERQRHLMGLYCAYAAEHLARLLDLTRARATAATLQEELLPARLPRIAGVRLAVRHRTGPHGGGDWYDALPLPEGALGLAVGAVSGAGPSAVAAMGRLRASLRAYAVMEGEDPVAVLSDLELLLRLTEPARSATALFAYCEPALRKVVLAGAGHCPPLLIGELRTEFVETSLSAPLGMLSCWEAPSVELEPASGETLLLYSDGLLHRSGEEMDRAFARLHAAAASVPRTARTDPEAVADHVLRAMLPDGTSRDAAGADAETVTGTVGAAPGGPEAVDAEDIVLLVAHFE